MNGLNFILGQDIERSEIILFQIFGLAKRYIFNCKLNEKILRVEQFFQELKNIFGTERTIAKNKGQNFLKKFNFKWKNFLEEWSPRNLILGLFFDN